MVCVGRGGMIKQLQDKTEWHRTFVLFPREMQGCFVWLCYAQRRRIPNASSAGDFSGYSFDVPGWEWKL